MKPRIDKVYAGLIRAFILFVVGVLFCFSAPLGTQLLSILLGVALIISGVATICISIAQKKSLLSSGGILGGAFIALGIVAILENVVNIVIDVIPWVLIAVGALAIIDAFLLFYSRKERKVALFVLELILGIALVALGICLLVISGFSDYAGMVFGIALIVYAVYSIIRELTKKS
ncbi:MAG: hypothetical protein ACI4QH_00125 [Candidatus Fimimonas sp.]